jgi:hypothetical protein
MTYKESVLLLSSSQKSNNNTKKWRARNVENKKLGFVDDFGISVYILFPKIYAYTTPLPPSFKSIRHISTKFL